MKRFADRAPPSNTLLSSTPCTNISYIYSIYAESPAGRSETPRTSNGAICREGFCNGGAGCEGSTLLPAPKALAARPVGCTRQKARYFPSQPASLAIIHQKARPLRAPFSGLVCAARSGRAMP